MDVAYRPAGPEDLEPGLRVVEKAFNELRGRNGLRPVALREPAFQRFSHAEYPTGRGGRKPPVATASKTVPVSPVDLGRVRSVCH
jgi:hypothetical protein